MSELRIEALRAAVALSNLNPAVIENAKAILAFLQDSVQPANPPEAAPATRKPRATKPTPASTAEGSESAPAAAGSAPNTSPAPGVVQPAEPTKAAATPGKAPTLDDVRNALVQCQTRKGGKDVPQAILNKYSPSKTTGGLPQDKYITVINECAAA